MTLVFGLTGGIASGKSAAAARFRVRGIPVLDADVLARQVVEPGSSALPAIEREFGPEVLADDGTLDRKRLAAMVFEDRERLRLLEAIVHPRVRELFAAQLADLTRAGHALVGYEVPLLFEKGLEKELRPVVLIAAPERLQVERALTRGDLGRPEVLARMRSQMPLAAKVARADLVVENDADLATLHERIDCVIDELRVRAQPR